MTVRRPRALFPTRVLRGRPLRAYFLLLAVVAAAAAIAAIVDVETQGNRDARASAEADARFAARTGAKQLGDYIGLVRATVRQLADNPQIGQTLRHPQGCSLSYSGFAGRDRGHIDILRPDGSVACSSRTGTSAAPLAGYAGAAWLRRALTRAQFVAPATDRATGAKVAIAAVPIPGAKGIVAGFADLTALGPELASLYDSGHPDEFLVTTADGRTVVARSIEPSRWIGASTAETAFAGSSGVERRDLDGTPRLYESVPVPGVGWRLFVGEDRNAALASASRLENRQLQIILGGFAVFLLVAFLVYRSLAASIRRLSRAMSSGNANALPLVAPAAGPAELADLTRAIGGLISSVDRELQEREGAEARVRAVIESALDAVVTIDHEGRIVEFNPAAEAMFGFERDAVIGEQMAPLLIPTEWRDAHLDGVKHLLETGEGPVVGVRREVSALRADGSEFPVEIAVTRVPVEGPPMFTGYLRDISERKRAEADLRRSEEQYRLLFENNPNPMWIYDLESLRFLAVNDAAIRSYGYSRSEFLRMTIEDIRPPEDVARLHTQIDAEEIVDARGLNQAGTWRHRRKDGSESLVEVVSHALPFGGRDARVVLSLDVTARVEAELALRRSEARYRDLVENASDLIATVDLEHRLTSVNAAFADSLGYSREELIGRPLTDLVPAESHDVLRRAQREKIEGRAAASTYEHELVAKDGGRLAVEVSSRLIEESGRPVGIQAICRDVTARREAQRAQRLIAAIVESSDDAIVSRGLDGTVLTWNAAAERLFGYGADEMIGRTIDVLIPEGSDELPRILEQLQRGESVGPFETQRVRKDGRVIDVSSAISPIRDEAGRIIAAAAISRDVSERKQAERALRHLAAIVESSDDAIISTAIDGTILTWNRGAERIYGYGASDMVGRHAGFLEPDEHKGEVAEVFARLRRGEQVANFETVRVRKDGTPIHISLTASPIRDHSGEIVAASVIVRDIGERVTLEEQLRQSQKMEAVGRLAGGVAHDFNNLLTVISGYTDALLEEGGASSEAELREIQSAARRATVLTAQLLAFSRQQVLQPRVLALNEVIEGITPMLTRLIGSDVELMVALDPSVHPVLADPNQVEQVLLNLVINARDAMPSGGKLTIETDNAQLDAEYVAAHEGAAVGAHAMIAVTDTGAGMDADTLAQAFDPFFTSKPVGVGTGLGLSTVHGIVKQSGGNICVYSEVGRGTSFKIYLPASDAPATAQLRSEADHAGPQGSETILLVEDEEAVRTFTARTLRARGYTILVAEDPEAALRLADESGETIDLLLTDLVMPGMGGRELAERVTARIPGIAVLFMSGYAGEAATRNGALETGGAYLQKPFSANQLARTIRTLLDDPGGSERRTRSAAA